VTGITEAVRTGADIPSGAPWRGVIPGGTMARVIDPVCGMEVDPGTAAQVTHESRTFHFCSEHCVRAFRADPERYLGVERHEPPFTTDPMPAPKFGAAGSGGLENEPVPERHDRS
jgi:YHS domain-containing protein